MSGYRPVGILGPGVRRTTGTSSGTVSIDMLGGNALYVANAHSGAYGTFTFGVGPQTATIGSGIPIPGHGQLVVSVPPNIDTIATIASTTSVNLYFIPCKVG
jgi:hypothetical protein